VEPGGEDGHLKVVQAEPVAEILFPLEGAPELLEFHPDELEELVDEGRKVVGVDTSRMPPVGDLLDRDELDALLDFLMII